MMVKILPVKYKKASTAKPQNTSPPEGRGIEIIRGITETGPEPSSSVKKESSRININTATADELKTLPGIGDAKAQDIMEYRTEKGPFRTIEDIMKISGIKDARFKAIKDRICV
jgi:competence protein ComEA